MVYWTPRKLKNIAAIGKGEIRVVLLQELYNSDVIGVVKLASWPSIRFVAKHESTEVTGIGGNI